MRRRPSYAGRKAIQLINAYRAKGGGRHFFGVSCNFSPTCSDYTRQAIEQDGLRRGIIAGWRRIRRCTNPDQVEVRNDPYPGYEHV